MHTRFDTLVGLDMTNRPALAAAILAGGRARRLGGVNNDLVIPRSERGYEPLCAIYSRACEGDIHARLTRREYEAATLPAGMRVAEIGVGNDLTFVNVNTPHDYERAKRLIEWKPESTQDRITTGRTRPMTDADS
jgi:molybdopterin-guanine dinucleotide biosynthesis protein A